MLAVVIRQSAGLIGWHPGPIRRPSGCPTGAVRGERCERPLPNNRTVPHERTTSLVSNGFHALGVSADLCEALAARGIEQPFAIQTLAIPDAIAGRDVCGKAKTGSGKTLAFGLPVLQTLAKAQPRRPAGLALVPTRELALQVHDELEPLAAARGLTLAAVYGGARIETQIKKLVDGVDFVVGTPGRLIDLIQQGELSVADVDHVVIDEADRMADMGFLPQVEWILRHIDGRHQTLLFSATLDGVIGSLVRQYQTDPVFHEVESRMVTVDQMVHRFVKVHELDKVKVAAAIVRNANRVLVFTRTKRAADKVAASLVKEDVKAAPIHGDLRQNLREKALNDFSTGKLHVLVATDVAARGIHVDDIDVVIHFDPPEDHKAYLHRSGRTARAGEAGMAVSLVLWNQELEVRRLQNRLNLKQPIVEMFSNDARLADLAGFEPAEEPSTV
ncbi:MAG: DEAD/DEAH box helicase [Acidimicrobiales bacterium]|nr:DEAD/DEAH box helicase [Acidimicrobiales bacterium]